MDFQKIADKVSELTNEKTEYKVVAKNSRMLNALIIGNGKIRPTIYLDSIVADDELSVAEKVVKIYNSNKVSDDCLDDVMKVTEWNYAKDNIIPCLIKKGTIIEEDVLFIPFKDDIDMFFKVVLNFKSEVGLSSVKVKKTMLDEWNVTAEEVKACAIANLDNSDFEIKGMFDILKANGQIPPFIERPESETLYVVSNKEQLFGSNVLLSDSFLENIKKVVGEKYFIIPSSVHEIIVVRNEIGLEPKEIANMVESVNNTVVSDDEILSYHVYQYDNELCLVA